MHEHAVSVSSQRSLDGVLYIYKEMGVFGYTQYEILIISCGLRRVAGGKA